MSKDDRSAVVYVVAAAPGLIIRLIVSYLRMRRHAVKAERRFYRSLVRSGMDRSMALELAEEYSSPTSITYWIKDMGLSPMRGGPGKEDGKDGSR